MNRKKVVVITGLSGGGKTTALNILEDLDFYTIDNLPLGLEKQLLEIDTDKLAVGVDIRTFKKTTDFKKCFEEIEKLDIDCKIIYLEAETQVILGRYNLTRRSHPIKAKSLLESIQKEIQIMEGIKEKANFVFNTSRMRPNDLEKKIRECLNFKDSKNVMNVHIQSFGFKYGLPIDADLVFDLRFIPNPYYVEDLKNKTGLDKEVKDYIMKEELSKDFKEKLFAFVEFLIPQYIAEGKKHLTIAMGCSGGQHRSVVFAELLREYLQDKFCISLYAYHRERELGRW